MKNLQAMEAPPQIPLPPAALPIPSGFAKPFGSC